MRKGQVVMNRRYEPDEESQRRALKVLLQAPQPAKEKAAGGQPAVSPRESANG
jgi:hypothetical protein